MHIRCWEINNLHASRYFRFGLVGMEKKIVDLYRESQCIDIKYKMKLIIEIKQRFTVFVLKLVWLTLYQSMKTPHH